MKYFHIDSKIDKDLLNKFFEFCNNNPDDEWTISLWTVGGQSTMADNILYAINKRPEKVTLICQEAYSGGFHIFYHAKCKKCISKSSKGMTHVSSMEMRMNSMQKPVYTEDECVIKNWQQSKKNEMQFAKNLLTKKEFKKYKKGDEVYFTFKRMKEIFPDAEII
jgi:ATP-dependent protease ClpP protease subunit